MRHILLASLLICYLKISASTIVPGYDDLHYSYTINSTTKQEFSCKIIKECFNCEPALFPNNTNPTECVKFGSVQQVSCLEQFKTDNSTGKVDGLQHKPDYVSCMVSNSDGVLKFFVFQVFFIDTNI